MKQRENETAAPRGKGSVKVILCAVLVAASISAGYFTAPEDTRLPVLLDSGEVIMQPCYVAVDGHCVAVVKNEKVAEKVIQRVEDEFVNSSTIESRIEENATIEKLDLKNGDSKPEILTALQASQQIVEQQFLTVETREVVESDEIVAYKVIEKESSELNLGEVRIAQQGCNGIKKVTKEVIKENGEVVDEEIISQKVIEESIPEIRIVGTAGLAQPLAVMQMTSTYGFRWGRQHEGVDLGLPEGAPIYAAKTGTVTFASYTEGYGNLVKLDHGDGMETYYAHCSRIDVAVGQQVETGQQIAAVGSTGNSTGPHLHFEVRIDGVARDPMQWLKVE